MTDDILQIDTDERVRTLTLNRPQSQRARRRYGSVFAALADAEAGRQTSTSSSLTGADPVFCAGLAPADAGQTVAGHLTAVAGHDQPVIGAINGAAVTGGLELALYCDILIASPSTPATSPTPTPAGLPPTWGLSVRLPQKGRHRPARRMSLTGYYLPATDAPWAGLVTEVVAHDQLLLTAKPGGGVDRRQQPERGAGIAGVLPPHRRVSDRRRAVAGACAGQAISH